MKNISSYPDKFEMKHTPGEYPNYSIEWKEDEGKFAVTTKEGNTYYYDAIAFPLWTEWEVVTEKSFTEADIKVGMRVTIRRGGEAIVVQDDINEKLAIAYLNGGWDRLVFGNEHYLSIVEVYDYPGPWAALKPETKGKLLYKEADVEAEKQKKEKVEAVKQKIAEAKQALADAEKQLSEIN